MSDLVRENLCVYDHRSDLYETLHDPDYPKKPRNECGCDRCFYGTDRLAVRIAQLEAQLAIARELLKESRDDLEYHIDQEYPYRHDYPHMMAKWNGSMDIVRRIDEALEGEENEG